MDIQNNKGNTGLHFLMEYGYKSLAEYFVSKGANPSLENENNLSYSHGVTGVSDGLLSPVDVIHEFTFKK